VSLDELRGFAERLRSAPLSGFEPEAGEMVEAACADLGVLLGGVERAAYAVSDGLQRRFFSHAATPAPLGIGDA
jgi:hypothetical protein